MAANMQASFSTRVGYGGRGWAYGSPSSSELQARARCSSVRRGPASSVGFPGLLGEGQAQVQVVFMGSSWFLQVWLASLSFSHLGFSLTASPAGLQQSYAHHQTTESSFPWTFHQFPSL